MNKKQFAITLAVVCVFSFLGGIVGGLIIDGNSLFAENITPTFKQKEIEVDYIKTRKIDLVNNLGKTVGKLEAGKDHAVIEASEYDVINSQGKETGSFAVDMAGNPTLHLYSKKKPGNMNSKFGHPVPFFRLAVVNEEPSMGFRDKNSDLRIGFGINRTEPFLSFTDKNSDLRVHLGVFKAEPNLSMLYKNKTRLSLGTNYLVNKKTGTEEKVKGSLVLFDNRGTVLTRLP
jgi:hypothetical protein